MAARRRARWYFDFISPFAHVYLKVVKARQIPVDLDPVPVLFAGLLKAWENRGPAEVPPKRVFTYRYCVWLAHHHAVPFRFPAAHPFNPLRALRLVIAAGPTLENVEKVFDVIWGQGASPETPDGWARLIDALQVKNAEERIAEQSVKDVLTANTSAAAAANIFGVPSVELDGEIFWGVDSIEMLEDFLRDPAFFRSDEMRRVAALPIGTARKT